MVEHRISLDQELIRQFCKRHGIRRLSVFGSAIRDDFRPDSDIDMLVEFEPGDVPGLLGMAGIEMELTKLVGRKVDLRTPSELSRHFRDQVLTQAIPQYDASR